MQKYQMQFKNGALQNVEELAHSLDENNFPVIPDQVMFSIDKHLELTYRNTLRRDGKVDYEMFFLEITARFQTELYRTKTALHL